MGKANQQTPLRDKGDAELLSICSWLGPSTKAEQFLTKNGTSRNCESLPLSRASIPFIFFLPSFHCLLFPLGGRGEAGEASFPPLLHLHLSPTWSWYKYCTIPLKEAHRKDSHRHSQAGGLMPKWVYTGCVEKGPTAPGQEKQAQRAQH